MRRAGWLWSRGVAVVALVLATPAQAEDGAYGRLTADGSLAGHVGGVRLGGAFGGGADVRLRYLEAAGVGVAFAATADARVLSVPFELRPLFPIRFLKDQQTGKAFFDLVVDSLAFEIGPSWDLSRTRPGLFLGGAVEVPFMGSAEGLFLRVGVAARFPAAALEGQGDGAQGLLTLGLGWHVPVRLGIVDAADRRTP